MPRHTPLCWARNNYNPEDTFILFVHQTAEFARDEDYTEKWDSYQEVLKSRTNYRPRRHLHPGHNDSGGTERWTVSTAGSTMEARLTPRAAIRYPLSCGE